MCYFLYVVALLDMLSCLFANIKYKFMEPLLLLNNEDSNCVRCLAATWC